MTDTKFVESSSGSHGGLAQLAKTYSDTNTALTKAFDTLFGSSDATDTFDASCNTCKNFQRSAMTSIEKSERNIYGMPGKCALKQIEVKGWPRGQYCGFENAECYENRRTGLRPYEVKLAGA